MLKKQIVQMPNRPRHEVQAQYDKLKHYHVMLGLQVNKDLLKVDLLFHQAVQQHINRAAHLINALLLHNKVMPYVPLVDYLYPALLSNARILHNEKLGVYEKRPLFSLYLTSNNTPIISLIGDFFNISTASFSLIAITFCYTNYFFRF